MPKIVYIAHPISGDIKNNIKKIVAILKDVHTEKVIPFAPYIVQLKYLNDNIINERELGINVNRELFSRKFIDEIWFCGGKISPGMQMEVKFGLEYGIPMSCYNPELEEELKKLIEEYKEKENENNFSQK
jgi:hypothetical protein